VIAVEEIQALADRIAREFRPERIILFGSHAEGTAGPHSDVDLLIVMSCEGSPLRKSLEIVTSVEPTIPVDIIVRTPEHMRQRLAWNDFFLHEITQRGKVLYEAPDARMG